MKLTLEPSGPKRDFAGPKIIIETSHDELTVDEVLESLIRPALIGYGFQIKNLIEADDE